MVKQCSKCGETKPHDGFHRNRTTPDGRQWACKACVSDYMRVYNAKNMARIVADTKAWRAANPEKYHAQNAAQSKRANAKGLVERHAARAALVRFCEECGDPIPPLAKVTTRYCSTGCQENASGRRWKRLNPEKVRAAAKRYETENRKALNAKARINNERRRARKMGLFVEDVHPLVALEMDDGVCGICGEDVDPTRFDIDHVIPLSRGGEHSYANTQVAHPRCNARKHASLPWEMAA